MPGSPAGFEALLAAGDFHGPDRAGPGRYVQQVGRDAGRYGRGSTGNGVSIIGGPVVGPGVKGVDTMKMVELKDFPLSSRLPSPEHRQSTIPCGPSYSPCSIPSPSSSWKSCHHVLFPCLSARRDLVITLCSPVTAFVDIRPQRPISKPSGPSRSRHHVPSPRHRAPGSPAITFSSPVSPPVEISSPLSVGPL